MQDIHLYNTKTRTIETFRPLKEGHVSLYHCGPTVYNFAHIGNMRAYVFADTLRRMLEWNGFLVNQVINITDVGHLVSDADEGEDKMVLGVKREGVSVEDIIKRYSNAFYDDLKLLNIKPAHHFPRATEHIPEQIALIKKLEEQGYTYITADGVYFDTSKFPHYADFAHLDIKGLSAGERINIGDKHNYTDFALWKFYTGEGERLQEWDSPWGKGFPGWHIECSAMSMKYLGETLDIHTGGIDHIPVHHTNEIAQSECATGHTFANYWMHVAFMNVDNQKMSKSLGNTYRITELAQFGVSPLGYRYWLLTSNYRTQANFTKQAAFAAQASYDRLRKEIARLPQNSDELPDQGILDTATQYINNDLGTAKVIALIHEVLASNATKDARMRNTIIKIDELLGLDLGGWSEEKVEILEEISALLHARATARAEKNWKESDRIRDELLAKGYIVKDTPAGQELENK